MPQSQINESPVMGFIVGMPRSGTTWMQNCLDAHPDVTAFGETGFWGKYYFDSPLYSPDQCIRALKGARAFSNSLALSGVKQGKLLNALADSIQSESRSISPSDLFDRLCRSILSFSKKTWAIEKTPHHVHSIERILQNYPHAKFIVMYRDPYEFMLSYKHQGDRKSKDTKKTYKRLYHPIGCALVYRGYVNSILTAQQAHTENCCLVKFRNIVTDPGRLLQDVQRFLRLTIQDDLKGLAPNSSFPEGQRAQLSDGDIFWMRTVSGKISRKLGYEPVRRRGDWIYGILLLFTVPVWLFHVVRYYTNKSFRLMSPYLRFRIVK